MTTTIKTHGLDLDAVCTARARFAAIVPEFPIVGNFRVGKVTKRTLVTDIQILLVAVKSDWTRRANVRVVHFLFERAWIAAIT